MKPKRKIYEVIEIENEKIFTLFDSGARLSYITEKAIRRTKIQPQQIKSPFYVKLGGNTHIIKQACIITGRIKEKYTFSIKANIVKYLGKENNREIDMIFGCEDMETWNIGLDLKNKKLDLTHFTKEFTEYYLP